MSSIGELTTTPYFTALTKVTLLLAIAWGIHLLLRKSNPRWRVALWRMTLMGLLVIPIFDWVGPNWQISVPVSQPVRTKVVSVEPTFTGPAQVSTFSPVQSSDPQTVAEFDHAAATARKTSTNKRSANSRTESSIKWKTVVYSIWLGIAGLLLLQLLRSALKIRSLVHNTHPGKTHVIEVARCAMADSGLRTIPEIRVSSSVEVPFAAGWMRPIVVLPDSVIQSTDAAELKLILTHELGHIVGKDVLWATFAWIMRSLLWFHPLIWRLPPAHQVACETVCDSLASRNSDSRETYRRVLARLALLANHRRSIDCGVAMSATAQITQRLRRLATHIPNEVLTYRGRILAAVLGFVGATSIAAATLVPIAKEEAQPFAASPKQTQAETPKTVVEPKKDDTSPWTIQLTAVDADTGDPIANPSFTVQLGKQQTSYNGNAQGQYSANFPSRTPRDCYLRVKADGYTPMRGIWRNRDDAPDELPKQLTVRMTRGITVGGIVVDEQQHPVEGAIVEFGAGTRNPEQRLTPSFTQEYVTDATGRWRCAIAPHDVTGVTLKVNHPDYALTTTYGATRQLRNLKTQNHTFTLKRGFVIQGVVTGPNGQPVEGAYLAMGIGNYYDNVPFSVTDVNGHYEFRRVREQQRTNEKTPIQKSVTVLAKGLAPQLAIVPGTGQRDLGQSKWDKRTINFRLDKGKPLTIRLTDTDKNPVEKVRVVAWRWRNHTGVLSQLATHGIPTHSDKNGIWHWENAPADEEISYDILSTEHLAVRNKLLTAGDDESLTLLPERVLTGRVVDANTRMPIDYFVIQIELGGVRHAASVDWANDSSARHGKYRRRRESGDRSYRYRFVAKGYEPFITALIPPTEGEIKLDVELKKLAN